jgi:hypothetical protein
MGGFGLVGYLFDDNNGTLNLSAINRILPESNNLFLCVCAPSAQGC